MSDTPTQPASTPTEAGNQPLPAGLINIATIGTDFIKKFGVEVTMEVTGKAKSFVAKWEAGSAFPNAEDLHRMLAYDPAPLQAVRPLYEPMKLGGRLAILMLTNRAPQASTMECVLKLFDPAKMQFIRHSTNNPHHGRDILAHKFLQSGCEWAFWVDDDMVLPCGDAAWFKQTTSNPAMSDVYAGMHTIGRLLHHKKTLIGACYFARKPGGVAQFNEASMNPEVDQTIKTRGPQNEIRPTKWVATGSMLVHRSVFTAIAEKFPDIRLRSSVAAGLGYTHAFFSPIEHGFGEDVSFCIRAEKAGHQPYVDLSVMPAHIGLTAFNYHNTR